MNQAHPSSFIPSANAGQALHPSSFKALPPLSLYVHIPWCVKKCPYCDFNSHTVRGELPEEDYIEALISDLEQALPKIWGRKVHTVFFGGGTPSLFSASAVDRLISAVRARVPLAADAEVTLEANPGTFETDKFAGFRAAGVNRLSIGVQSFNSRHLKALGRIHDADEARRAIANAREHFDNVNLDLMYGLPEQSLAEAISDIKTAIGFAPQHISAYHLTLEPNTLFHHRPPPLPDDDLAAEMQAMIENELGNNGYSHYETSAFAKPGAQCRHNLNYWSFGDYLGIGAGAHSKLSFPERVVREMRWKQPRDYLSHVAAGTPVQEAREVAARERPFEFIMNSSRLNGGFAASLFEERTALPLIVIQRELGVAEDKGLLARDHRWIAPTSLGRRFLNDLIQIFLPAD
ncbi:MAG: radical SAM family heme chaperone HemW [Burkholderiales bacterium]